VTVLTLQLKLMDDQDNLVWDYEESFEVRISEKDLKKNKIENYQLEIPFVVEDKGSTDKLKQGRNSIFATLINKTDETRIRKIIRFSFEQ